MVINQKPTGRASSMPAGIAMGGLTALAGTILLSAILAKLAENEILPEENIGYGIMVLLLVCSFSGAGISCKAIKRKRMVVSLLSGGVYMAMLLSITALFFGGQYSGVGVTALLVLCGSMLAAFTFSGQGRKKRKPKMRNR